MAVGKVQTPPLNLARYYLFEQNQQGWVRYRDHTDPVDLPPYLADPAVGYVTLLSAGTRMYDYIKDDGHKNIGAWIDQAARKVGR
jgi:hypothetical protein